jgi:glucose/arabinose dehydrogenase
MHKLSSVARRLLSAGPAVLALLSLLSSSTIAHSDDRGELTYGPSPQVPDGKPTWLPTVKWSVASETWPTNAFKAASGLTVNAFARDLKHPRWLYVLPNGMCW